MIVKSNKRNFRIKNSFGVYDVYKHIRKNNWYNIERQVTEKEFYSIVRTLNNIMQEELSKGELIELPYCLGDLKVVRTKRTAYFSNGELVVTYPVLWKETLTLWENDEEAKANKTLIRNSNPNFFSVKYLKSNVNYSNSSFFNFKPCRTLRNKVIVNVNNNNLTSLKAYGI